MIPIANPSIPHLHPPYPKISVCGFWCARASPSRCGMGVGARTEGPSDQGRSPLRPEAVKMKGGVRVGNHWFPRLHKAIHYIIIQL